jgi:hypothetical protein
MDAERIERAATAPAPFARPRDAPDARGRVAVVGHRAAVARIVTVPAPASMLRIVVLDRSRELTLPPCVARFRASAAAMVVIDRLRADGIAGVHLG